MKTESTKKKRVWHSGPPPHVGWWNASYHGDRNIWRWWDGDTWCGAADDTEHCTEAAATVLFGALWQKDVRWNDYYPENARVPRINPEKP